MRNFSKIFFSTIAFILVFISLCIAVIEPMMHSGMYSYFDAEARKEYAGTLDYLFTGASQIKYGIKPITVDERLGCNSYNLSGTAISWYGRIALLEEELSRNPVQTVVIEVSFDTFSRNHKISGDLKILPRLDSIKKRIEFIFKNTSIDEMNTLFGYLLSNSKKNLENLISGKEYDLNYDHLKKGNISRHSNDITLDDKKIDSYHNSRSLSIDFDKDRVKDFYKMVEICKSHNVNIIYVMMPISDRLIWSYNNWESFSYKINGLINSVGGTLYDFNLLKNRYELFNDSKSFNDTQHMSSSGAYIFSKQYCRIMNKVNNLEDISDDFYSSYTEMRIDSPYNKVSSNS